MRGRVKALIKRVVGLRLLLKIEKAREVVLALTLLPLQGAWVARRLRRMPAIETAARTPGSPSIVESYWSGHLIWHGAFFSATASLRHLARIADAYPLYREYCGHYAPHAGATILDYGCGPGNDLVGWAVHSQAARIIGMDVSHPALTLARRRLALHAIDFNRLGFVRTAEADGRIPLPDASVDYINCLGVLHHTSDPDALMREFFRVLKPGGEARLMVYNRDSLYLNLIIPYELQVLGRQFHGLTVEEAYTALSDGGAPISRCHVPAAFVRYGESFGFAARYLGASFRRSELDAWHRLARQAIADSRLAAPFRAFIGALTEDAYGHPTRDGFTVGLNATFALAKPTVAERDSML